jgi:hypothetical protein
VRVYPAGNQVFATTTWTKIVLDTETFDTLSEFSANRFTAKFKGTYRISGSVTFAVGVANQSYYVNIYVNGASHAYFQNDRGALTSIFLDDIVYLAGGDYVELFVYTDNPAGATVSGGSAYTFLNIQEI